MAADYDRVDLSWAPRTAVVWPEANAVARHVVRGAVVEVAEVDEEYEGQKMVVAAAVGEDAYTGVGPSAEEVRQAGAHIVVDIQQRAGKDYNRAE